MIPYDLHIHTQYCGHAEGLTVPVILNRAKELGLETIAITDHVFGVEDLPIIERIRHEVEQMPVDFQVFIGAEVNVDGCKTDGSLATDDVEHLDYVVAGIHHIPGQGRGASSPLDVELPEELFERWQDTFLGLAGNAKISTIAHPGRLIADLIDIHTYWDRMLETMEEAAKLSARSGICWELNEHNGNKIHPYLHDRWHEVYRIALNAGVRLVYGSDAHSPEMMGKDSFVRKLLSHLPATALSTPHQIGVRAA